MWIDGRQNATARRIRSDVCLIGAGAAGIALGLELAKRGVDVVLVESGGFEPEPATQALYDGTVIDHDYPPLTASRLRYLGGTTNHWGGACNPILPFEFETHAWVPHSGWPLSRADIEPFESGARDFLDLPELEFAFDASEVGAEADVPLIEDSKGAPSGFDTVVWRRTRPTPVRLRTTKRRALHETGNLRCIGHVNVTELVADRDCTKIVRALATTLHGQSSVFEARDFVLCAGAIENARLLLLSDRQCRGGLGNANDLVGRYFADHGGSYLGDVHLFDSAPAIREETYTRIKATSGETQWGDVVGFAARAERREKEGLLGFATMCFPSSGTQTPDGIQSLGSKAGDRKAKAERPARVLQLLGVFEKAPNRESRVTLTRDKDALGLRKVAVALNVQEVDRASIRSHAKRLAAEIAQSGHGRVRFNDFERFPWTTLAGHHAGTLRMADDPKRGVCDRDGRVHGLANLFVTGGALFPTIGWQNPTYTIVALALRLADRLTRAAMR